MNDDILDIANLKVTLEPNTLSHQPVKNDTAIMTGYFSTLEELRSLLELYERFRYDPGQASVCDGERKFLSDFQTESLRMVVDCELSVDQFEDINSIMKMVASVFEVNENARRHTTNCSMDRVKSIH